DLEDVLDQLTAGLQCTLFLRNRRRQGGPEHAEKEDIRERDAGQDQPGDHRGGKDGAHRFGHDVGQQYQDEARRYDLAEGARAADDAASQRLAVIALEKDRQRQQTERDNGGPDDAGRGAHQHANQNDGKSHSAWKGATQESDDVEQIFGQARSLQHYAHEHEERHGQKRVVGGDTVDSERYQVEQRHPEAEITEGESRDEQRNCNRHADEQHANEG